MSKHILAIDDEPDIRELLEAALQAAGYRVSAVASASEAISVLKKDPTDLIMTDLQLEETDGFEVIERLHAAAPDIPVILLTGVLFDPDTIEKTLGGKIVCYIQKTSPLSRILREVERHLAK